MKKKICYVNPGINLKRPISFIAKILQKRGYEIEILAPRQKGLIDRKSTRHYDQLSNIKISTYPVFTLTPNFDWPIPINLEFLRKSWRILKENEIIHVWVPFYPNTFIIALLKLLFFKRKTLILTMDTFPAYSFKLSTIFDPLFKLFYKTIGKIFYIASHNITVYAESMLEYAKKAGIPKKKLIVTPTGIDLEQRESDKDIRKEFNVNEEQKIVLYIGLHNKRKGIDLIIRIAKKLKEKGEKIIFFMVGEGTKRENAIQLVSKLSLKENFRFTGIRRDVHNFYNQADIFLLPSRGEGLAGVLMEAMIYQVPIVTSNIPGTKDMISHMENGLLCEMEDIECYTNSIIKILNDKQLQQKFKKKGLEVIKSRFLWEENAKKFDIIYDNSLKAKKYEN